MLKFEIKLRGHKKYIVKTKKIQSDSLVIKLKIKGLYLNKKFNSYVKLLVSTKKNKVSINDINIIDIEACDSSTYELSDIYKIEKDNISFIDSLLNGYQDKVYNQIKNFVKHIKFNVSKKNFIESIIFSLKHTDIEKINLKGMIYKNSI